MKNTQGVFKLNSGLGRTCKGKKNSVSALRSHHVLKTEIRLVFDQEMMSYQGVMSHKDMHCFQVMESLIALKQ